MPTPQSPGNPAGGHEMDFIPSPLTPTAISLPVPDDPSITTHSQDRAESPSRSANPTAHNEEPNATKVHTWYHNVRPLRLSRTHHHSKPNSDGRLGSRSTDHKTFAYEPVPNPTRYQKLERHLEDGWTTEIAAVCLSVTCIVAIAIVLREFDGQPVPQLPEVVSLNTIISVLSTVSKSLLMYAISACIGQAKWSWFSGQNRQLRDLELLDEASRGPLGSLQMLFARTVSSVASLGAVITLLSLATDPFVQQVVQHSSQPVTTESDIVSTGKMSFPAPFLHGDNSATAPITDNIEAINSAIWSRQAVYDPKASCPTGNCSWPAFESLDWCMETTITDVNQVRVNCDIAFKRDNFRTIFQQFSSFGTYTTNTVPCEIYSADSATPLSYPITFSLEGGRGPLVSNPAGREPTFVTTFPTEFIAPMSMFNGTTSNVSHLDIPNPVLALGYASFDLGPANDTVTLKKLEQAVISLCKTRFDLKVEQGIISGSASTPNYGNFYSDARARQSLGQSAWCWAPDGESATFNDPVQTLDGNIHYLLDKSTLSFCTNASLSLGNDIANRLSGAYTGSRANDEVRSSNYTTAQWKSNEDVMERVRDQSLSIIMGSIVSSLNRLYKSKPTEAVTGSFTSYQTVVEVRWEWLALPVAIEIMGLVFLLLVVRGNSGVPVWKGSILAALYHGLEDAHGEGRPETASEMADFAKRTSIRLTQSERTNGLVLGL
ncbi:hypothetical protein JX266_006823 [Neoarthrinium moseri]|nr:hypothetical protein JX266_006823 [Neoarthrinium moseri]